MSPRTDPLPLPDRLETTRLHLRPYRSEDVRGFVQFMTDPDATRYMLFAEDQMTPTGARRVIEDIIASYDTPAPVFALAAAERNGGRFVGTCGLSPETTERAEVFFALLPRVHGRGLGREMVEALVRFAFEDLALDTLSASASLDNAASLAVLAGLGFAEVGPAAGLGTHWQRYELAKEESRA